MDPKAKQNLLVDELLDETVVYDLELHRVHCLNATAGFLLRSADGTKSVDELTRMAEEEFGVDAAHEAVGVGLERLHRAGLVEWESAPPEAERLTRRETLKKIAVVGMLLPTVMTLASPTPAQAVTGLPITDCTTAQDIGRCCANNKTCVPFKGSFRCSGAKC